MATLDVCTLHRGLRAVTATAEILKMPGSRDLGKGIRATGISLPGFLQFLYLDIPIPDIVTVIL